MIIKKLNSHTYSSKYGNQKVFGQPLKVRSGVVVQVELSNGVKGYGESYQSIYLPEITKFSIDYFSSFLKGKKITNISDTMKKMRIPFSSQNGLIKGIYAAIEMALWDAKSRVKKVPLFKLLNKKSKQRYLNCYGSGGSVVFNKIDLKNDIELLNKLKLNSYKMRVGLKKWNNDLERIKYVKKNIGQKKIMIDAIMGTLNKWTAEDSIKRINSLKKLNLKWIEEPINPENIFAYKEIKKKTKTPVALGESFTSFYEFETAIRFNCCDIIQPDISQIGISECIEVIQLAKKFKKKISLHVWGSPLSFLANLHFATAFKEIDLIEFPLVKLDFLKDKVNNLYSISNGKISLNVNKIKGLGINITKKEINKFKFRNKSGYKIS